MHVALGIGEGELHRLGLEVDAVERRAAGVIELAEDAERLQRRDALAVGRDLAHVDAAVVPAQRLDPVGVRMGEVVERERRDRADGIADGPAVEAAGAFLGDPPERAASSGNHTS